jgi:hypothetical protein
VTAAIDISTEDGDLGKSSCSLAVGSSGTCILRGRMWGKGHLGAKLIQAK